jgi:hypothetical protein
MNVRTLMLRLARVAQRVDTWWQRLRRPDLRDIVFDARTATEYAVMAPVHRRLLADSRVRCWLMSSAAPEQVGEIFGDAPRGSAVLSPRRAMLKRFDVSVAADLIWATLPRGTRRVQMFHGVAGKWSRLYDRPTSSMRHWDRLFFINRRRLENHVASGAVDRSSPAIRLVGMPKSDCLVDGSIRRNDVLEAHALNPSFTTVLYAPTWTRFSSLNVLGEELVGRLVEAGWTVLVKLHDNSLNPNFESSGAVDWVARLTPILAKGRGHLITSGDASPWLVAADVLITDHSSIGFEYLLLDRPLVRLSMPELIRRTDIPDDYVQSLASVSTTVETAADAVAAVAEAVSQPLRLSAARRALAAELFHEPGSATDRAVDELYALMELAPPPCAEPVTPAQPVACAMARAVSP